MALLHQLRCYLLQRPVLRAACHRQRERPASRHHQRPMASQTPANPCPIPHAHAHEKAPCVLGLTGLCPSHRLRSIISAKRRTTSGGASRSSTFMRAEVRAEDDTATNGSVLTYLLTRAEDDTATSGSVTGSAASIAAQMSVSCVLTIDRLCNGMASVCGWFARCEHSVCAHGVDISAQGREARLGAGWRWALSLRLGNPKSGRLMARLAISLEIQ
jgi:hypothetical protein